MDYMTYQAIPTIDSYLVSYFRAFSNPNHGCCPEDQPLVDRIKKYVNENEDNFEDILVEIAKKSRVALNKIREFRNGNKKI